MKCLLYVIRFFVYGKVYCLEFAVWVEEGAVESLDEFGEGLLGVLGCSGSWIVL